MAVVRFCGPAQLTGSPVTQYTVPADTNSRVLHIHASNPSASAVDVTISIGADAAGTRVYDGFSIPADRVVRKFDPYDLAAGDTIQAWSSATTTVLTITGIEFTTQEEDVFNAYALLEDQKAQATAGGGITANNWTTRDLNTEVADSSGIVSISANQFTLQAGTYLIKARAPAWFVEQHKIRLRNITDSTTDAVGASMYAAGTSGDSDSTLVARITIASAKTFEIQHLSRQTRATDGLGVPTDTAGTIEVYTQVEIWRES